MKTIVILVDWVGRGSILTFANLICCAVNQFDEWLIFVYLTNFIFSLLYPLSPVICFSTSHHFQMFYEMDVCVRFHSSFHELFPFPFLSFFFTVKRDYVGALF